jgi:hypothetical protein
MLLRGSQPLEPQPVIVLPLFDIQSKGVHIATPQPFGIGFNFEFNLQYAAGRKHCLARAVRGGFH